MKDEKEFFISFDIHFDTPNNSVLSDSIVWGRVKNKPFKKLNLSNCERVSDGESFMIVGNKETTMYICYEGIIVTTGNEIIKFDFSNSKHPLEDATILFNLLDSGIPYDGTIGTECTLADAFKTIFRPALSNKHSSFLYRVFVG